MYNAEAGWARIEAPEIYAKEYDDFRRGWTTAFGATYFDFPGDTTMATALFRWRLAERRGERSAALGRRTRRAMDQALGMVNRSLGTVIVNSIAISIPKCRRAAESLRDQVAEVVPA